MSEESILQYNLNHFLNEMIGRRLRLEVSLDMLKNKDSEFAQAHVKMIHVYSETIRIVETHMACEQAVADVLESRPANKT